MTDRIEHAIAVALSEMDTGWLEHVHFVRARDVMAALKAARIAVVELPEPCGAEVIEMRFYDQDEEREPEAWLTVAVPETWQPDMRFDDFQAPAGLTALAAALLAAAESK